MEETKKTGEAASAKSADVKANKINAMALISYIGVLSLIPFLSKDGDEFAKFHAKQGFTLFLFEVATYVLMAVIPIFGWILADILGLLWVVLSVIGIINVANNKKVKLPVVGDLADKF